MRAFCTGVPLALALVAGGAVSTHGQEQDLSVNRYGYFVNSEKYPQTTPQDALKSFLRAYDNEKHEYMLAQLMDPKFVDDKIGGYVKDYAKGSKEGRTALAFSRLLKETRRHFLVEPQLLKELRLFAEKAEWQTEGDQAVGTIKGLGGRQVSLRRHLGRWFLENKRIPKK